MPVLFSAMKQLLLYIVLGLITLTPCSENLFAEDSVVVGVIASLSDEWAANGQAIVCGAELARDEVNNGGGINGKKIQLQVEDSREAKSGAQAVSAYLALRQRGVRFFIGPTGTPAGMSLAPLVGKESVVMITPLVGVRGFSDSSSNIFNARGVDEAATRSMARLAIENAWRKAGILSSQQPWESAQGQAFRDEYLRLGGSISSLEEPLPDTNDWKTQIAKVLLEKPDVIFFSNGNRLALAAKQLFAAGYRGPKLAALLDNTLVEESLGTLDGTIFATFGSPSTSFQQKYEKRFGKKIELGAATAYDALMALAIALKASANITPEEVITKLPTIDLSGASGEFSFGKDRIAKRALVKFSVVNGKIRAEPTS